MTETPLAAAFFASSWHVLGCTVLCTAITLPGFSRREQPALAAGDFLDVGVADDAQADQIAGRGEFGR